MKPPIPHSYWVEPGRVLAGEHPDGDNEKSTRQRVAALLSAGVRSFIDLTEPDELPSYRAWLPIDVVCESFPMPDHSLPRSRQQMRDVQHALERLMGSHAAVYVHCRAGIGRTGMVVGCYLREQGETPMGALAELNRLWKQNARAARWPSIPETPEQERYISEWRVHALERPGMPRDAGPGHLQLRPVDRYRGCLLGMAVADIAATAPADLATSGWSDDTGMALCVAESLLACDGFDGRDQLDRLRSWAQDPGASGAASTAQLRPVVREVLARALWNRSGVVGSHDPAQQDGSPLARCAAPALFAAARPLLAQRLAEDVVRITHQAPVPVDACRLFTAMVVAALQGQSRARVLGVAESIDPPLRAEVAVIAAEWLAPPVGRRKPATGILGALDRVARSFARGTDYAGGLERALSAPAAERDAVAAGYGALAGAWYGAEGIPAALRQRVADPDTLDQIAAQILDSADAVAGRLP